MKLLMVFVALLLLFGMYVLVTGAISANLCNETLDACRSVYVALNYAAVMGHDNLPAARLLDSAVARREAAAARSDQFHRRFCWWAGR